NSGQTTLSTSALAAGSHVITAQYGGDANDAGSISPALTQVVNAITLVSIAVTPDASSNPSVPVGLTQQYTVIGSYSDGSTADVTSQVTWSSFNTAIAAISNSSGSNGLATGAAIGGPVTITAALGAVSGASALTVTNATLLSGTMIVPSSATIPAGLQQQFNAFGDFSDGNTYDITTAVIWSSSNTGTATISNASGSQGLATAVAAGGPVTITAS